MHNYCVGIFSPPDSNIVPIFLRNYTHTHTHAHTRTRTSAQTRARTHTHTHSCVWSLVSDSWKFLETPDLYHPSFDCVMAKRETASSLLQSMRNNLRQLPVPTFSGKPGGILRGWDLTVERNEEPHLRQSVRALCLSVSATKY